MASYLELDTLASNADFCRKVRVAVVVSAQLQLGADPGDPALRKVGLEILKAPDQWGNYTVFAVLAANKSMTVEQITGASDEILQGAVDAVLPGIAKAFGGI